MEKWLSCENKDEGQTKKESAFVPVLSRDPVGLRAGSDCLRRRLELFEVIPDASNPS